MSNLTVFSAMANASRRKESPRSLSGVPSQGWRTIFDFRPGAWQANESVDLTRVDANWAVFSCKTLIAADCGKVRLKLVEMDSNGIWKEAESPAFSPVLRKPNHFQTRQQFIEQWITSKLSDGNAYILKERDNRGVVVALYVLDPSRARPLVAKNGDVYYQLQDDDLAQVPTGLPAVPASEIIHDRMNCLFHPLVGISPIYASGLSAMQGLNIQNNSASFFRNQSQPGGVLTAPAEISDDTAKRLKEHWETNYTGAKAGRIAVLGDGLKYERMGDKAVDAQMVEQLKLSAEMVCTTFHVPPFKVGIGAIPAGQKVEDLNTIYYSDCLGTLFEAIEALLDDGLGLTEKKDGHLYGTYLELDDLMRMDSTTLTAVLKEQVGSGISKLNEARKRLNMVPMEGGDAAYLQQQNYSVEALSKRDARPDPFATAKPPAPALALPGPDKPEEDAKAFAAFMAKTFDSADVIHA